MFFMMVCFEVFYFEFTINLPPPTGGGLVQRWRYEKLPIAGDFLSSYTKVEAGYTP
jgi:hypothetical protein